MFCFRGSICRLLVLVDPHGLVILCLFRVFWSPLFLFWPGALLRCNYGIGFHVSREGPLAFRPPPSLEGQEAWWGYLVSWTSPVRFGARVALLTRPVLHDGEDFRFTLRSYLGRFSSLNCHNVKICVYITSSLGGWIWGTWGRLFPLRDTNPALRVDVVWVVSSVTQSIERVTYLQLPN